MENKAIVGAKYNFLLNEDTIKNKTTYQVMVSCFKKLNDDLLN